MNEYEPVLNVEKDKITGRTSLLLKLNNITIFHRDIIVVRA